MGTRPHRQLQGPSLGAAIGNPPSTLAKPLVRFPSSVFPPPLPSPLKIGFQPPQKRVLALAWGRHREDGCVGLGLCWLLTALGAPSCSRLCPTLWFLLSRLKNSKMRRGGLGGGGEEKKKAPTSNMGAPLGPKATPDPSLPPPPLPEMCCLLGRKRE